MRMLNKKPTASHVVGFFITVKENHGLRVWSFDAWVFLYFLDELIVFMCLTVIQNGVKDLLSRLFKQKATD